MKTILLKFAAPLQSWGANSHFEVRHTDFYPSKSAVIGLIAASFGYRRNENEKISKLNEIDFAVRIDEQGHLLRDYQIAQKFKDEDIIERTYVTNRYYLEDAIFVVAISHKDDTFMENIFKSLNNPYFQQFLGRKSTPVNYDFLLSIIDCSPLEALKKERWHAREFYKKRLKKEKVNLEIYCDNNLVGEDSRIMRKDKVISFSQKNRTFKYRYESKIIIMVLNDTYKENDTYHDPFKVIGD